MVKSKNGRVRIKGNGPTIEADVIVLLKEVRGVMVKHFGLSEEEADRHIDYCVEMSRLSEEEVEAKLEENIKKLLENLLKAAEDCAE